MRRIIGICGQARSGKDTIADYLSSKYNFRKIAFADKLKWALSSLFFLSNNQLYGDKKEEIDLYWNKSPRALLQGVGDKLREVHPDIWIRHVRRQVESIADIDFVITDIRYKNELQMVKEIGGDVWFVRRPTAPEIEGSKTHASEMELLTIPQNKFDKIIINDNLQDTYNKIDKIMKGLD